MKVSMVEKCVRCNGAMTVEVSIKDAPDMTRDMVFITGYFCASCKLMLHYGARMTHREIMELGMNIPEGAQIDCSQRVEVDEEKA